MGVKTAQPDFSDATTGGFLMHGDTQTPDFSGYATKAGLKCSDGRTIMPDAFKHQDTVQVPLVWQHGHNDPANILGHAILEHRDDGVYTYAFFNSTEQAKNAKTLVQHKDIVSLSIFANQLVEKGKNVLHGFIREVSLVLSGANPGALIDNIELQHSDGESVTLEDEAVIYTGLELSHEDSAEAEKPKGDEGDDADETVQDVYDSMSDEQKNVVHYMVGNALKQAASEATHSGTTPDESDNDKKEGRKMTRNVFDQSGGAPSKATHTLTHDAVRGIVSDAIKGGSLKDAVEGYALKHGIENIDVLFPDARAVTETPEFDQRRVEWVSGVINATKKSPFSRIKSIVADITHEQARARGYIKGTFKKEEFFGLTKRTTSPTTIYKKQKLDRDDIIDITDFDVVAWLKAEMRVMFDEELARAILLGDGRDAMDDDKVKDPAGNNEGSGIRSILHDHDLYAATVNVNLDDAASSPSEVVDKIIEAMRFYKGSGSPTLYTTLQTQTSLLLAKDTTGRRLYQTVAELANAMGVSGIVTVEPMEDFDDLVGIIVNLRDYTVGTDKGGDVSFFDDFDIDYNQHKYLLESRASGALTKIRSALIIKKVEGTDVLVKPEALAFDEETGVITYDAQTGVVYKRADTGVTVSSNITLDAGDSLKIFAVPASGYYFDNNVDDEWTYRRPTA